MNVPQLVEHLLKSREHSGNIAAFRHNRARPPTYAPLPDGLDPRLQAAYAKRGIDRLYTHQAEAIQHTLAGRNVVVVTPTASGKTLCYNLPVLDAILKDPNARALYLFPTKALAQDQQSELHRLVESIGADIKTFTYDGDTPATARRAIRQAGHVVVTNPDMLHTGILPHHDKWVRLFENLATSSWTSCTTTAASSAATSPTSSGACGGSAPSTAATPSSSAARPPSPTPTSWARTSSSTAR